MLSKTNLSTLPPLSIPEHQHPNGIQSAPMPLLETTTGRTFSAPPKQDAAALHTILQSTDPDSPVIDISFVDNLESAVNRVTIPSAQPQDKWEALLKQTINFASAGCTDAVMTNCLEAHAANESGNTEMSLFVLLSFMMVFHLAVEKNVSPAGDILAEYLDHFDVDTDVSVFDVDAVDFLLSLVEHVEAGEYNFHDVEVELRACLGMPFVRPPVKGR